MIEGSDIASGMNRFRDWVFAVIWFILPFLALAMGIGGVWMAFKFARLRRREQEEDINRFQEELDETDRAFPPRGKGLCQKCKRSLDEIFFLPDGRALCRQCYRLKDEP